jgi:hypothetical protein
LPGRFLFTSIHLFNYSIHSFLYGKVIVYVIPLVVLSIKTITVYTKLILLLTLLAYSVIVAQFYMYIVALKNVQYSMKALSYIELRKLLDRNFRANYKYAVYAGLISNSILVSVNIQSPGSLQFITAAIAFAALLVDVLLMMKGNMPINNLINSWSPDNYPDDWAKYREKWLRVFLYREVATITGFISLVIGAVFAMK